MDNGFTPIGKYFPPTIRQAIILLSEYWIGKASLYISNIAVERFERGDCGNWSGILDYAR